MDPVFLSLETSSAGADSYPIEIGWAFVDGRCERHLIHPIGEWLQQRQAWDPDMGTKHGLTVEMLQLQGELPRNICSRLNGVLGGRLLYCETPESITDHVRGLFAASGTAPEFEIARMPVTGIVAEYARSQDVQGEAFAWAEYEASRTAPRTRRATDSAVRWAMLWQCLALGPAVIEERMRQGWRAQTKPVAARNRGD